MAVNDDLADDAILRSIRSIRAGNGVWKELLPILRKVERDLLAKLAEGVPRSLSTQRAERLLREIREIINGGAAAFQDRLEGRGIELAAIEEAATVKALERIVPVQIAWVRPSARLLEAVAVSQPFEGAILKDHVSEWSRRTLFAVQSEIRTGIVEGEGIEPIQRRIRRVSEIKTKDARGIARTYVSHVTNESRAILYVENQDVIAREQWLATLDDRTCLRCAALDNKAYPVGKGPRAPLHFNCRCVRVPVTRSAEKLADRGIIPKRAARNAEGMTGQVPADMSFPQWLRRQPENVQKDVLGKTRYEMFKSGTTFDKFVNDENEIIPLRDL